ncbi:MAG: hypothetical protein WCO69_00300 [Candidatus Omnitrophota bacterium]
MAIKKKQDLLKECDTQRDSLYTSLGRLLYENIQSGGISYFVEYEDPALAAEAKRLIRDVVVGKISDRKPRLDPFVMVKRKAKVQVPVVKKQAKPAVAVKASPKKNAVAAVIKGVGNVLANALPSMQQAVEAPAQAVKEPTVERRDTRNLGFERRGQIEPYTKLLIEHHVNLRKLREIRNDFNDGITVGLLYSTGDKTAVCQSAVDEKFRAAIALMEKKQEAIRLVMEKKKQFFAEDKDNMVWKPEEDFLKELELDAAETSRRIDGLIGEVVDLFNNIKSVYAEDVRAGLAQPQVVMRSQEALPESEEVIEEPLPVEEEFEEALAEESAAQELQEEASVEEDAEEVADDDSDDTNGGDDQVEKLDYGLFETGARKLLSEAVDQNEKLSILHTLFRNAPRRVVPYLYELVRGSEVFMRRQLINLLGKLDYPTMVDLYRRFITDESSSMRLAGMMGLVKLDSDESKHVIVSAVNDRDANVRRFIVNHLDHNGNEPDATALARLSRDNDEMVARIAVRKLGMMSNHFSFVSTVPLLESVNIKVRKEAISALLLMTGTDLGYDCGAPEVERARAVRQWKIMLKESYTRPRFLRDMRLKYANMEKEPVAVIPVKTEKPAKTPQASKPAKTAKKAATV